MNLRGLSTAVVQMHLHARTDCLRVTRATLEQHPQGPISMRRLDYVSASRFGSNGWRWKSSNGAS